MRFDLDIMNAQVEKQRRREWGNSQISSLWSYPSEIFAPMTEISSIISSATRFSKDFGLLSKPQSSKLGLACVFRLENLFEKHDVVELSAWKGIHDTISEEVNGKIKIFLPSMSTEQGQVPNIQAKIKFHHLSLESSLTQVGVKY